MASAPAGTRDDGTGGTAQASGASIAPAVFLELVRELQGQRASFEQAQRLAAAERRSERRWKMLFQGLIFGVPVLLGIGYFLFFLSTTGFRWGPFGQVVGIVRVDGPIGSGERASADRIVPLLEKAFANPTVRGVVLSINSPGGAPVEAERIHNALQSLKVKHPKPVVAVINDVGASAAFMIAVHADQVVAGKYSIVGSIGAIMTPWRLDRALGRFDVTQQVYASGKLKSFLNPYAPMSAEQQHKAQHLVDQVGAAFLEDVKALRGDKLKPGVDFGTGEVWAGEEAKALGLVDQIGTLEQFVETRWGLRTYDFGPAEERMSLLGGTLQNLMESIVRRALVDVEAVPIR